MLLWITILGFFGAAVADRTILDEMNPRQLRQFFGTAPDQPIPEYELVTIERPKRAATRFTLDLNYQGTRMKTTLNIVNNGVINRNTGVWLAYTDRNALNNVKYNPDPSILENIGNVVFYQDHQTGSALTYYERTGTFTGVLCTHYAVKKLHESKTHGIVEVGLGDAVRPRTFDESDEQMYALFKMDEFQQENFRRRFDPKVPQRNASAASVWEGRGFVGSNVYHPKLLVPVEYGAIYEFTNEEVVQYLIAHWNAVDMLYRRLKYPVIRLHVAGFILAQDAKATPYIAPDAMTMGTVDADAMLVKTNDAFFKDDLRFLPDSYNIIMAMTRQKTCLFDKNRKCDDLLGYATLSRACSRFPGWYHLDYTVGGVGIAKFNWLFGGVSTLAHEIGHILGVDHDGEVLKECPVSGGYTMVPYASAGKSLDWSSCSKAAFKSFFESGGASCMLTKPYQIDSRLQHLPGAWLSIDGTCKNVLKYSDGACDLPNVPGICHRYGCLINNKCVDSTFRPWEGSHCGNDRFCMDKKCRDL